MSHDQTGTFPELGGGAGLELGKARCRDMIEAFGGRVTGSVSGKVWGSEGICLREVVTWKGKLPPAVDLCRDL